MVIVGNKVDLESERQVPRKRGEKVRIKKKYCLSEEGINLKRPKL